MSDAADARAKVTQALHDAIEAGDGFDDGEFVATWVAVVYMSSIERPNMSSYYLMTPDPDGSPAHVVRGLLHEGLESPLLEGDERE